MNRKNIKAIVRESITLGGKYKIIYDDGTTDFMDEGEAKELLRKPRNKYKIKTLEIFKDENK